MLCATKLEATLVPLKVGGNLWNKLVSYAN